MYGIIGSAVMIGVVMVWLIKKFKMHTVQGQTIVLEPKDKGWIRYIVGGTLFGFGWAMVGACPGPMFILVGNGYTIFLLIILSALFGTFLYGLLKDKLPH